MTLVVAAPLQCMYQGKGSGQRARACVCVS